MREGKRNTKLQWKRIVSMMLAVLMVLTSAPLTELAYANEVFREREIRMLGTGEVVSPEVNGNEVTFRYYAPDASKDTQVSVRGTMNNWTAGTHVMTKDEATGVWSVTISDLSTGGYQYKFCVGENGWTTDPRNPYPLTDSKDNQVWVGLGPVINGNNVTLQCYAPDAENVFVAGTMNGWSTEKNAMTKDASSGIWSTTIELNNGCYLYKFVAKKAENEAWLTDCGNKHIVTGGNAVLAVNTNVASPEIDGDSVTFRYCDVQATEVKLAGSMNGDGVWADQAVSMEQGTDGVWYYTKTDLAPGTYTYKYIIPNGEQSAWIADPQNPADPEDKDGNSAFTIEGDTSGGGEETTNPSVVSPEVNGKKVTFRYKDENATAVYLAGEMNGWDKKANLMTKGANGIWEITLTLEYGRYEYKFVVGDDGWTVDPGNPKTAGNGNSVVIVPGLVGKSVACLRGGIIDLPQLDVIDSDGNKNAVDVTYSLKDAGVSGVTLGSNGTNQTLTVTDDYTGDKIELQAVYNNIEATVPVLVGDRFLVVEYTRDDKNYTDMNIHSWGGSANDVDLDFEVVGDKCVVKVPVAASTSEKTVGFNVKRGAGWDGKIGGDNNVVFPADQKVVKVKFAGEEIESIYPYNAGAEIDGVSNQANFYFRDDKAFLDDTLTDLKGKVNLVLRKSTEDTDKTIPMTFEEGNARFAYSTALEEDTDYYYYYTVNGQPVLDAYNENTIEVGSVTYNKLRNRKYQLDVTAAVKNFTMDYNQNNLLSVDWTGKDGDQLEGFTVKEIYADLSALGLGGKVAIDPQLKALSIGCDQNIAAGAKNITVTVKDDGGQVYSAQTTVNVTDRVKEDGDFDWDEAVIYFAVTDRFYDGDTTNNTLVDETDTTNGSRYHGGDIKGLTDKLDYLQELGVNTIWLTPIVDNITKDVHEGKTEYQASGQESYAYHGYWASDFTKLNPHLGTDEQLKALISGAHDRNMKIMVDVVLNHAGYDTENYFNSIISNGADGHIPMIRDEAHTEKGDDKLDSLSGLPDFMTENEEVRNQLVQWQTAWMKNYDIDYYRVDTVKHVDSTTWSAFKNALTEENPEFKLIGEYFGANYTNSSIYQNNGTMDSLLDFGFKDYAKNFVQGDITGVETTLAERNASIGNTATLGQFLSSHDEQGLLTTLGDGRSEDEAKALMKVAAALQITAKGQPVIYYGEELGQSGKNNYPLQENRYDFNWTELDSQKSDDNSFYNHYRKLLNIRKDYLTLFAKGERNVVKSSNTDGYDIVRRSYDSKSLYVAMNIRRTERTATFATNATAGSVYKDLYDGTKTYTVAADGSLTITIPSADQGGTAILVLTEGTEEEVADTNQVTVKLHYNRPDGNYTNWNAWLWTDGLGGKAYDFVEENGEMVATITVEGRATCNVNYIIRKGEWDAKDVDADQSIDISDVVSGTVHFYVNAGVAGGTKELGADAVRGVKIVSAKYDENSKKVIIETSAPVTTVSQAFTIKRTDGVVIAITSVGGTAKRYELSLGTDLSQMQNLMKSYIVSFDGYDYVLGMPNVYVSEEFENKYTYTGNDLGATWSKESTTFKVWAPTADKVSVALYESGTAGTNDRIATYDMMLGDKGVWSVKVDGNLNGKYYTYLVDVAGKTNEACDPYARTTGVNGKRAMVINLAATNPDGWEKDVSPNKGMTYTDAVIYELHVRDASIDASSGVSAANQGKFLGLTERGTTTANGTPTVLDHMKDMGVTHVHLLPVYDYGSVDETKLDTPQFNWGYDPVNYNVPEGSYATDPYNGDVRDGNDTA